jgi:hypothetical protein
MERYLGIARKLASLWAEDRHDDADNMLEMLIEIDDDVAEEYWRDIRGRKASLSEP